MPKWIDTAYHIFSWSASYDKEASGSGHYYYFQDWNELGVELNKMIQLLERHQYVVRAVMPLRDTHIFMAMEHGLGSRSDYGYGAGFGVDPMAGFVIIGQKEFEVSEEEYRQRVRRNALEDDIDELKKSLAKTQQGEVNLEIEERSGIFGKSWVVNGKKYRDKAEAQAVLAQLKSENASAAELRWKLEEKLNNAQAELDAIEAAIGKR